jgi:benzoate-CoA ligase family
MVHVRGEDVRIEIPAEFNLSDLLIDRNVREGRGNKVAVTYVEGSEGNVEVKLALTYADLLRETSRIAGALRGLGVEMENRVVAMLYDRPELAEVFLGSLRIGAVPVPINTYETAAFLKYVLNQSRAKVLFIERDLMPLLEEVRESLRYLRRVVVVGGEPAGDQLGYRDLARSGPDFVEPEPMHKDDFAFWLYSSGTTGPPKGVVHLQHDIPYVVQTYYRHIHAPGEDDVFFSTAKLFFAYGLGNGLYAPLWFGASTVLFPGRATDAKSVLRIIERMRVTRFFSTPLVYLRLLDELRSGGKYDLSSIRTSTNAGETLRPDKRGMEGVHGALRAGRDRDHRDTAHIHIAQDGQAGEAGEHRTSGPGIRGQDRQGGRERGGRREAGRLLVKGDSIAALYWQQHEKTKATIIGEWIDTGDLYVVDRDGYFWWSGRADDLIKSAGAWVSPIEVEQAILGHPAVAGAAVVQSYTDDGIGRPKAYVQLRPGYSPSKELEEEILRLAGEKLKASYKVPGWIEFVDALPTTATGKIQRYKLRQIEMERFRAKLSKPSQ